MNYRSTEQCIACFNYNPSLCWQCNKCEFVNQNDTSRCSACDTILPVSLATETQLSPRPKELTELIIDRYINTFTKNIDSIIPSEINKICFDFYNDIFYWKFDVDTVEEMITATESQNKKPTTSSDTFEAMGIQFQLSFYQNIIWKWAMKEPTSSLFLETILPANVKSATFFMEASCVDYDAQWKYEVTLDKSIFTGQQHKPIMFGYRVTKGTIAVNIDISSIKYNDGTPDYSKPIEIPEQASCEWKFDKAMIDKFGSFVPRQTFLSPLFDNKHQNWGLWILPMGFEYVDLKDRMVEICVCLYKKPNDVKRVNAEIQILEYGYGEKYTENYTYWDFHDHTAYSRTKLMKATDLLKLDQLTISAGISIEILKNKRQSHFL